MKLIRYLAASIFLSSVLVPVVRAEDQSREEAKEISAEKAQLELNRKIQVRLDRVVNKLPQFSMVGRIEEVGRGEYTVNGERFKIDPNTEMQGTLRSGVTAEVRGFIVAGKPKLANQVVVMDAPAPAQQSEEILDLSTNPPKTMR